MPRRASGARVAVHVPARGGRTCDGEAVPGWLADLPLGEASRCPLCLASGSLHGHQASSAYTDGPLSRHSTLWPKLQQSLSKTTCRTGKHLSPISRVAAQLHCTDFVYPFHVRPHARDLRILPPGTERYTFPPPRVSCLPTYPGSRPRRLSTLRPRTRHSRAQGIT